MAIKLANYNIAFERNEDDTNLWFVDGGLGAFIRSVFMMHSVPMGNNTLSAYTRYPKSLPEWLSSVTSADISRLRVHLAKYGLCGRDINLYLRSCWMLNKCKYQNVLIIPATLQEKPINDNKQIAALREHLKAVEGIAKARGASLLWVFDWDSPSKRKPNTYHVHIYSDNKAVLKDALRIRNLHPFVPTITGHKGVKAVHKPKISENNVVMRYDDNDEGRQLQNSLSYGANKVSGITTAHLRTDIGAARRSTGYDHVVAAFNKHRGGRFRHWGYTGFGLRG